MQRYYARIHIFRIPKNKLEEFEMGFKRINEVEKLSDWLENYDELCMEAKK